MRNVLNRKKNQASDFSDFYFFELWSFFVIFLLKSPQFSMNFHDYLKNKNRKNGKINFSFDSAYCASFMKMGAKLRGGGSVYPYLGQGHVSLLIYRKTIKKTTSFKP